MRLLRVALFIIINELFLCASGITQADRIPAYSYTIVNSYPHDANAFTQGLIFHNGYIYEGTGLLGKSFIYKIDLETGKVLQQRALSNRQFGEGITIWQDKLIQLTWKTNIGYVYDLGTFERKQAFHYPTEGWGLTHDDKYLIMSDGSETLYFLDPKSFKCLKQLQVRDRGKAVKGLNELEFIKGEVFANVWPTDKIVRISPTSGEVLGWIDLSGINGQDNTQNSDAVLNGIAYDEKNAHLFVTGKNWPKLYEIKLIAQDAK